MKNPAVTKQREEEQHEFLNLRRLPATLYDFQVAHFLQCHPDDIPALINRKLLKPLGHVSDKDSKRFSRETLFRLARVPNWLQKVTEVGYGRRQILGNKAKGKEEASQE